jgi:acetyl-CoA C-acetyltransferase
MPEEVVVLSAVRTAIGDFGGALKDTPPSTLAALVAREAIARSKVPAASVGSSVFGHVINTEPRDMYLGRVAAIDAGLPQSIAGLTVNRLCGSGLQAVLSAAQQIMLGDLEVAVAGGAEVMSRSPHAMSTGRWGARMGDVTLTDMMLGALRDPFNNVAMGVTAENVARRVGISRVEQDELAVESHRRAIRAQEQGAFNDQLVPVQLQRRQGAVEFARDEHARSDISIEQLASLRPAFQKDGTVTAGNASSINDGAAAVVLASAGFAKAHGLKPLGRLVGYAHAGVDPLYMGLGPIPAVQTLLERRKLCVADVDVVESNEAFAAQAIAVARALKLDPEKTNIDGSGISLGHPIGATGAILLVKALYALHRRSKRLALVTMCIGGGQGIAALIERTD